MMYLTLMPLANNLRPGGYEFWTDYQAIDEGILDDDDARTCTFRPSFGPGPEIKIVKDACRYCECVLAWISVRDGGLRHHYIKNQCNRPKFVLCQKSYDSS